MENVCWACGWEMATAISCSSARRLTGTRETVLHVRRTVTAKSVALTGATVLAVNVNQVLCVQRMEPAIPVNPSVGIRNAEQTDVEGVVASVLTTSSVV